MEIPETRQDEFGLHWYWDNSTRAWKRMYPGQNDPDWSHATGGDNDQFANDQNPLGNWEQPKNPMGEGITAGFFGPSPGDEEGYNGHKNWETWNLYSMMINEPEGVQAMEQAAAQGPEAFQQYVIQNIIGPYNNEKMLDAKEWNSFPMQERLDQHYDRFKDEHPQAAGLADSIGDIIGIGGPNIDDIEPELIDPDVVDWQELYRKAIESAQENQRYSAWFDPSTYGPAFTELLGQATKRYEQVLQAYKDRGDPYPEQKLKEFAWDETCDDMRELLWNHRDVIKMIEQENPWLDGYNPNLGEGDIQHEFQYAEPEEVVVANIIESIYEFFQRTSKIGNYTDTIQTPEPLDRDDQMEVSHPPDCPCEKCQFGREMDKQQQVHPQWGPFNEKVPRRNEGPLGYDDSFPSMTSKTAEYYDDEGEYHDDDDFVAMGDDEPQMGDAVITAKGEVYLDDKLLGVIGKDFPNEEDAYYPIYEAMENDGIYGDVWHESDHGGYERMDMSYFNYIVKKENERINTKWDEAGPSTYPWAQPKFTVGDIVRRLFQGYQIGTIIDGPRWNLEMSPYSEKPAPDGMYREYLVSWEPQRQQYKYREMGQYPDGFNNWEPEAYLELAKGQDRTDTPEQAQQLVTQAKTASDHPGPGIYNSFDVPVEDRPTWVAECPQCGLEARLSPSWHGPAPRGGVPCRNCGHVLSIHEDFLPESDIQAPDFSDLGGDTPEQIRGLTGKTADFYDDYFARGEPTRVSWYVDPRDGQIYMSNVNEGHAAIPSYNELHTNPEHQFTKTQIPSIGEFKNGLLKHYPNSNESYPLHRDLYAMYNEKRQQNPELPPIIYDTFTEQDAMPDDPNPVPQIKLFGSDMSDIRQPHEWRHLMDKFAWEDAQPDLASCTECSSPMIDRGNERFCGDCGSRQPIIYANKQGGLPGGALMDAAGLAAPWLLGPEVGAPVDAALMGSGIAGGGGGGMLPMFMNQLMGGGGGGGQQQPPEQMDYAPGTVAKVGFSDDSVGLAVKDDGQDVNPDIHSTDGNTNLDGDDPSHTKNHDLSSGAEGIKAELHQAVEEIMEHVLGLPDGSSDPVAQALDKLLDAHKPGYRGENPDATVVIEAEPTAVGTESDSDGPGGDEPSEPESKESKVSGAIEDQIRAVAQQFGQGQMDYDTFKRMIDQLKPQYYQQEQSAPLEEPTAGMPPQGHFANLPMSPAQPGGSVPAMQSGGDATQMGGPCEVCGGAHNTAMHGVATPSGQGMHAVGKIARRPKLCPYHSDIIDYSLQFGDPKEALSIIAPQQYGSQWCKSGEFRATCNFKPAMVRQEYWDQRENELQQRRLEREQETVLQQQEAPVSPDAEIAEFSDMDSGEGYTAPEVDGVSAVGAPMEMAAHVKESFSDFAQELASMGISLSSIGLSIYSMLRMRGVSARIAAEEAQMEEQGNDGTWYSQEYLENHPDLRQSRTALVNHNWTDAAGNPLIEGQTYKLKSPKYPVADEIVIKNVQSPNKLTVEVKSDLGISYEEDITPEAIANNGFQFEPDVHPASQSQEFNPETNDEHPFFDNPGGTSDLSDLPTPVSHMSEPDGEMSMHLQDAMPDFEGVDPVTLAKVAGRDYTHQEQMGFINEGGRARNIEDLDLSGSHYGPLDSYLHDINDEFAMGW